MFIEKLKAALGSRRQVTLSICVLSVLVLVAGISMIQPGRNLQEQAIDTIAVSTRIKWLAYASYIGTYVAEAEGYFSSHGLDVEILQGGPQVDATKLVAAGSNDFGICGGDQLLVARSQGLPVVAIAALMQQTPAGFMVHDDSDIQSMADFPGHIMRVIPGHNTEIEYRAVMGKLGINTDSITELVNFTELQLFLAREVDIEPIYLNNQPATASYRGVKFRVFTPTDYGVRSYGNVYFTTEEMIKEQPETVYRFISSILEGWKFAFDNMEQAVDDLMLFAPNLIRDVELEKLTVTEPLMAREDKRIGWMELERWQEIATILYDTAIIDEVLLIDECYANQFLERYYQER